MLLEAQNLTIDVVRDADQLRGHLSAWQRLVEKSLEPNIFFEPGPFLAALETLPRPGPLAIVLVFAETPAGASELVGFFPFYLTAGGPFGRIRHYRLYTHFHCYLSTPLVDRDRAVASVDRLLAWIQSKPDGVGLFHFIEVTEDGPVADVLRQRLAARRQPHRFYDRSRRALFRPSDDAEAYVRAALRGKRRKEYRRQLKRLADHGEVRVEIGTTEDGLEAWGDRFLALEALSWKGRSGTALAGDPAHRRFFGRLIEWARTADQLMVLGLTVGGRPIALKCNLLAGTDGGGAFAFKIAYDPAFSKYSPGVLLEIETIRALHEMVPKISWMDSCALPDHSMIDRLWPDRRCIARLVIGTAGPVNRIAFALHGLWSAVRRRDGGRSPR